jgi:hypothetical protein
MSEKILFDAWQGKECSLLQSNQIDSGAQLAFFQWVLGTLLAQHLHLVVRLRMSGSVTAKCVKNKHGLLGFHFY